MSIHLVTACKYLLNMVFLFIFEASPYRVVHTNQAVVKWDCFWFHMLSVLVFCKLLMLRKDRIPSRGT